MGRTTTYAAVLLAAATLGGAALGQSLGGGQNLDLAPADPIVPLPLAHPRMESTGGVYTAIEFVMYRLSAGIKPQQIAIRGFTDVDGAVTGDLNGTIVNTDTQPPFIIRGPLDPGHQYGSRIEALNASDLNQQESFQPGWALTVGYKFDSGSKIELVWTHVQKHVTSANASLNPPGFQVGPLLADTFLFSPVFNFPVEYAGPAQKTAIGNPNSLAGIWNGAINEQIRYEQRYDQWDVAASTPWIQNDVCRIYARYGGRFAWIFERFNWRTVDSNFAGASTPQDVANYTNTVSNRMYGPFAGFGIDRYLGYSFAIALEMDAAGLVDVARERANYERGDRATESKASINRFTFAPEVNASVNLYWYPVEGIQVRAGYNFKAFFDTIAMDQPVAFDWRSPEPNWTTKGARFLDGFNAGIALIF
jgi:hypothetical protein